MSHHDGDRPRGLLEGRESGIALHDDDVHPEPDQLGGELRIAVGPALGVPDQEGESLVFHVAEFPQPLPEGLEAGVEAGAPGCEDADLGHLGRLLRLGGERRGEEAEGPRHERPSVHYSIT